MILEATNTAVNKNVAFLFVASLTYQTIVVILRLRTLNIVVSQPVIALCLKLLTFFSSWRLSQPVAYVTDELI